MIDTLNKAFKRSVDTSLEVPRSLNSTSRFSIRRDEDDPEHDCSDIFNHRLLIYSKRNALNIYRAGDFDSNLCADQAEWVIDIIHQHIQAGLTQKAATILKGPAVFSTLASSPHKRAFFTVFEALPPEHRAEVFQTGDNVSSAIIHGWGGRYYDELKAVGGHHTTFQDWEKSRIVPTGPEKAPR